jgi:hypothetical protein
MNWRKHMVLIVGGGVAVLSFILALLFMLRARGEYSRVNQELENSMRRLETLSRRNPFPSPENIRRLEENLSTLREFADRVDAALQKGRLEPEAIEAAEFAPLLERTLARLSQRAAESGVLLPERLTLGMARYAAGELPANETIPRLVIQLKSMDALCRLLFETRIHSLLNVEREAFEIVKPVSPEEPVVARRRGGEPQVPAAPTLPPPSANPLYETERFTFTFQARDATVWETLNALARSPLIAAVVDVQLANTAADKLGKAQPVSPISGGEPPGVQTVIRYPTHEERIVAGRELIQATVTVDVYRFVKDLKEERREG